MKSFKKFLESKEEKLYKGIIPGDVYDLCERGTLPFTKNQLKIISSIFSEYEIRMYNENGSLEVVDTNPTGINYRGEKLVFKMFKFPDEWYWTSYPYTDDRDFLCDEFEGVLQFIKDYDIPNSYCIKKWNSAN